MIFPGYITLFKDSEGFIHLYFFPGIDDNETFYYKDLDLSKCNVKYSETINDDSSKEYIFDNKKQFRRNILEYSEKMLSLQSVMKLKR